MKKTLSMIIAIAMIAAMLAPMGIFASATEVVEVSTWAEFVEQANANFGEGSYKLTADSAATVSVEGFYGTFDGDNHTITASTTLFDDISGPAVIKNFTVNPAKDAGGNEIVFTVNPVIHRVLGSSKEMPVWISGVTNNVSVGLLPAYELDGSSLQDPTGGIIGLTDSENWIYMYDVVNNGNMVSDDQTGGIIGNCGHTSGATYLTMVNVVNNGDVFAYNSYAGGIVGNVNAQLYADFSYCINNGNVSSENNAGGIIGQVNGKADVSFSYCANSGTIDQNPIITLSDGTERKLTGGDKTGAKYGAAGICPRFSNSDVVVTMDNCVIMGALDNDSTEDNTAYSSADPFNAWNKDNQAIITINDCYYLYGMNAVGEYAASLQNTGFFVLEESACKDAFDAIVADAPNQPAPEIETPELTPVDIINVLGYVAPTTGAAITDPMTFLSVPADAPYSIIDAYWYNDTVNDYVVEENFIAGSGYSLGIEIKFADGYVLADEYTIQFNGNASLCDPEYTLVGNENVEYDLRFWSVITDLDPLDFVDTINVLGYVAPTVGGDIAESLAGLSVPDGALYSITEAYWYDITNNGFITSGNFEADCTYALNVVVETALGYNFAETITFQFNGDANLVNSELSYSELNYADYLSVSTNLSAEGGDTPTEKTEIDRVDVSGITAPMHGQTVVDYKTGFVPVLPDGANYSVRSITITEINLETLEVIDMLEDGDVFDSSKTYSVGILVEADDGYIFATDAVLTANGGEDELINTLIAEDKAGVAVAFTPAEGGDEPIDKIEIDSVDVSGITAPMHGQTVVDYKTGFVPVLPDGANYTFGSISWIEIDPETMTPTTGESLADDYVFDSAKLYAIVFTVYPAEGYAFAEDAVITANGGNAEIYKSVVRSDFAYIAVTLTPNKGVDEPIVIDTINVNGYVAPTVGAAVIDPMTFLSVPADAPYSIVNAYWHDDTVLDFVTEGTFLAGHIYALGVVIVPDEGYVFADELTLMFNGDANLVDADYTDAYSYSVEYWTLVTDLSAEGGDEPTAKIEIDSVDVSGVTAPEYGKTVADYKASFVPVLPDGANYTFAIMAWIEIDPETMASVSTETLADDHVFDSTKTYGALIGIQANDGYVFAEDAVITVNGGDLEVFKFMPMENQAVIAIAFNPDTKPVEIDKIEISGVTAPEYGKTVADYKASFVPVLPEGAKYTLAIIAWTELDPETMTPVSTEVLADDYVFDSTKTYGAIIGIQANDGYVFAGDAVITVNGGEIEVFESMAMKDQALIAIVFNSAPVTGDSSTIAVFAIAALAAIGCVALTLRKKED